METSSLPYLPLATAATVLAQPLLERLCVPCWTMPLVLLGRLDALAAFEDVVAARLLDVDVLAGLAGPDGDQRVPVVAGGDGDGVEVLVFQGLADVLDALGRVAALLLDLLAAARRTARLSGSIR